MSGWAKLNWALLVVVIGVLALNWGLEPDPTQRNFDVLPGMVTAVSYESFSANPVLAGGMTQQTPPPGTIARQYLPLHYAATPEDALRAGLELENSFMGDDPEAVARGEFVFNTYCLVCHGASGVGDGPVALRGFPTPASLLAPNARTMGDGRIFHVVTHGQGNMPGHASQIEAEDRWKVALWVRHLQQEAGPVVEEVVEEVAEEPVDEIVDGSDEEVADES